MRIDTTKIKSDHREFTSFSLSDNKMLSSQIFLFDKSLSDGPEITRERKKYVEKNVVIRNTRQRRFPTREKTKCTVRIYFFI